MSDIVSRKAWIRLTMTPETSQHHAGKHKHHEKCRLPGYRDKERRIMESDIYLTKHLIPGFMSETNNMFSKFCLVNDKSLALRMASVVDICYYIRMHQDSLKRKKITYEEYASYKNPHLMDLVSEGCKAYYLMVGEYRIALLLRLHTPNGWKNAFYSPFYEECIRCLVFPQEYNKGFDFENFAFVSLLEDIDNFIDEKDEI